MAIDGILDADLAAGLEIGREEDRAIYRQRVADRYALMRKGALLVLAKDYCQGSYAHLTHREIVRKIADRSINYMLADGAF